MSELYPWLVPTYHKISQTFSEGLGHHALLIKADQGLGAEGLFEALTKHIMCQTPDNAPCGHCHACHLMASLKNAKIQSTCCTVRSFSKKGKISKGERRR